MDSQLVVRSYQQPNAALGATTIYYVVLPNRQIIFSGSRNSKEVGSSTRNNSEEVIRSISQILGLDPLRYKWFDVQTHLMYGGKRGQCGICLRAGEFKFDQLKLVPISSPTSNPTIPGQIHFEVSAWRRRQCPREVMAAFGEYIGSHPRQV